MNTTPPRKINRISFLDQGFSIGDSELNAPGSPIKRSHWKPQSSATRCKLCDKTLSVKNGIVNCRKCGYLFCNDHTHYKVRLRNPTGDEKAPQYDSTGVWCRCCETCYFERQHVEINSVDLTEEFKLKRQSKVESEQLNRTKIQRNFIKLTNLLSEKSSVDNIANWSPDSNNCSICFVKFNLFIRRHHCRLCGDVVCDDPDGIRKGCSINVPLIRLVEKLPNLNYQVTPATDEQVKFRCCVNCKNALLFDWKRDANGDNPIFTIYDAMLLQKQQIERIIPQFELLVNDSKESLKSRNKLVQALKDLEDSLHLFRNLFYYKEDEQLLVQPEYAPYEKLISNIYQSMAVFLQDNLVKYKQISDTYKQNSPAPQTPSPPRLTKKQIREMREQLMVMNEQKFLVEKLIKDYTKQRRFDELDTLITNKTELQETIQSLEEELGEFAF
ncbi:Vacuolar segregation protein PEP7 [Candida viswanathii]|uniref:Vacuolar segregation protein PEP7 n=1 Tax=Candida viswanathii TaxID=5486 RepID=A0A367YD96_9ASCO|nr:Vacuolar segregation protein PEP7 [Candida viswanathii]